MKKAVVGFILMLFVFSIHSFSQDNKDFLIPADNNEARLNRLQPPETVMDIFGIEPGMTIAEIGAGRGRYVVHLADRVGENGLVYAEDIDRNSLEFLEKRCREGGLTNVKVVAGDINDPMLPRGKLDLIFVISSYHHFDDPVELMKNARQALKQAGKVAIGEWVKKKDSSHGEGRTPETLEEDMSKAGYKLVKVDKSLEESGMYLYLFGKK